MIRLDYKRQGIQSWSLYCCQVKCYPPLFLKKKNVCSINNIPLSTEKVPQQLKFTHEKRAYTHIMELAYNPIPFDDTYVLYDPHDRLSFACAGLSLLPIGILVFYLSWFIITREIEPCIMAGGQVINDILNNIVKNYVKQPRPVQFVGFQENGIRSGYGMPSAHSQFMGFFATYLILRVWLQWRGLSIIRKSISTLLLLVVSYSVIFARVYLSYHDLPQVLVGTSIGCALGSTLFFGATLARVMGLVDWALQLSFVKPLHLKDSCFFAPLSLEEEHKLWLQRREKAVKKD